ncbi:hypothetical protein BDN67DRAFT_63252 [Paxillus ammoniavirescens]|nr:hypothetical protein BDN67DRAFT_63252 [Paxillus ammoniavirescens]
MFTFFWTGTRNGPSAEIAENDRLMASYTLDRTLGEWGRSPGFLSTGPSFGGGHFILKNLVQHSSWPPQFGCVALATPFTRCDQSRFPHQLLELRESQILMGQLILYWGRCAQGNSIHMNVSGADQAAEALRSSLAGHEGHRDGVTIDVQ